MEKKALDGEGLNQEIFSVEEAKNLQALMDDFIATYTQNRDKDVEEWLPQKLQSSLDISLEEAQKICTQLVDTIKFNEESAKSLAEAKSRGVTREAWVAKVVQEDVKDLPQEEQQQRLAEVYTGLAEMNAAVLDGNVVVSGTTKKEG